MHVKMLGPAGHPVTVQMTALRSRPGPPADHHRQQQLDGSEPRSRGQQQPCGRLRASPVSVPIRGQHGRCTTAGRRRSPDASVTSVVSVDPIAARATRRDDGGAVGQSRTIIQPHNLTLTCPHAGHKGHARPRLAAGSSRRATDHVFPACEIARRPRAGHDGQADNPSPTALVAKPDSTRPPEHRAKTALPYDTNR
jgi:hypothetical protein